MRMDWNVSVPVACNHEGKEALQGKLVPFIMEVNTALDQKKELKEDPEEGGALVGQVTVPYQCHELSHTNVPYNKDEF